MKKKIENKKNPGLSWKVHVANLLDEIMNHTQGGWIFKIPLQILRQKLIEVGERSAKINDPVLNRLMVEMAIYEVSDPTSKDFNIDIIDKVYQKEQEYLKGNGGVFVVYQTTSHEFKDAKGKNQMSYEDNYWIVESEEEAKDRYEEVVEGDSLYTAGIAKIIDSKAHHTD